MFIIHSLKLLIVLFPAKKNQNAVENAHSSKFSLHLASFSPLLTFHSAQVRYEKSARSPLLRRGQGIILGIAFFRQLFIPLLILLKHFNHRQNRGNGYSFIGFIIHFYQPLDNAFCDVFRLAFFLCDFLLAR